MMKFFLLGMFVMYLICSELLTLSERNDWGIDVSDSVISWVLIFPQSLFYLIGNKIYDKYKYWNLKSIVFDGVNKKWYYCDRDKYDQVFDYYVGEFLNAPTNKELSNTKTTYLRLLERSRHAVALTYNYEFQRFYKFRPCWKQLCSHGETFNARYVPKMVWRHFEPVPEIAIQFKEV